MLLQDQVDERSRNCGWIIGRDGDAQAVSADDIRGGIILGQGQDRDARADIVEQLEGRNAALPGGSDEEERVGIELVLMRLTLGDRRQECNRISQPPCAGGRFFFVADVAHEGYPHSQIGPEFSQPHQTIEDGAGGGALPLAESEPV